MIHCWHTQLRVLLPYVGTERLRGIRNMQEHIVCGGRFMYVTQAVRHRSTLCPAHVVQSFRDLSYTIIHIEEPQT